MFTFFSLFIIYCYSYLKRNVYLYLLLYGFCFFTFSLVLDGEFLGWWDHMYDNDSIEVSVLNIYYWFIVFLSYTFFFVLLKNAKNKASSSLSVSISFDQLRLIARFIAFISLFATVKNTLDAGNPMMLFVDSRAWEFSFGRNVIFNYLYFLHLFSLVLFGILIGKGKGRILDKILVVLLIASSFFHGIKFTIIHAFLFYCFSYMIVTGEIISNKVKLIAASLFVVLISFFVFARGGGVQGFIDYVTSPVVNSLYVINEHEFYEISSLSVFNPLSFVPFDRIQSRLLAGELPYLKPMQGFYLNDKYNLQHVITRVGYAFGLVLVLYSAIFALIVNYLRRSRITEYHKIFFLVMIMDTLLMFFTGFDFYKTKLWFNLFVAIFFYYLLIFIKYCGYHRSR